jgi:hypothetical protein
MAPLSAGSISRWRSKRATVRDLLVLAFAGVLEHCRLR